MLLVVALSFCTFKNALEWYYKKFVQWIFRGFIILFTFMLNTLTVTHL